MVDRKDVGSWLEGPSSRTGNTGEWPGQRLGLAPHGPGSIARFGRRLVGIIIDWVLALVIARGLFQVPLPFSEQPATGTQNFIVLGIFALMNVLLVGTLGTTIGHRAMGLQVRSVAGGRATLAQALVRTVLLCLAIPAVIWDRDGRGLHDKVPNTVIVRAR
ncbi:RDD family protein [Intrasporangium calvum]|uniref:RDD family protein n=1 Tax=Intrasporangium calvum TaxID=53358 RepID=A0ABT5GJG0_9MICO|nr:RDD family protein [Intrasporangium calvum]MDC5698382.1 RDD family protein [Intrasporangium calvum]